MYLLHSSKVKYVLVLMFILFSSTSAYAYASSNVVAESGSGDGAGAISGYKVENVGYTLNGTNPAQINSVGFTLTSKAGGSAATDVKAKLSTLSSTWFDCTLNEGTWTCSVDGAISVADADELRVVAVQ